MPVVGLGTFRSARVTLWQGAEAVKGLPKPGAATSRLYSATGREGTS